MGFLFGHRGPSLAFQALGWKYGFKASFPREWKCYIEFQGLPFFLVNIVLLVMLEHLVMLSDQAQDYWVSMWDMSPSSSLPRFTIYSTQVVKRVAWQPRCLTLASNSSAVSEFFLCCLLPQCYDYTEGQWSSQGLASTGQVTTNIMATNADRCTVKSAAQTPAGHCREELCVLKWKLLVKFRTEQ